MTREHILIADDNESVTTALALLLDRPGRTTIVCSDLESAEIMLGRAPVTALVTDVQFTGSFGFEGLHFINCVRKRYPHCRIVLMTGHPSDALRETAIAHGASALLAKPFEIADLEEVLSGGQTIVSVPDQADTSAYETIHVASLDELLAGNDLATAFQPIVRMPARDAIFAFEALTRVRGGWAGGGPAELFQYAQRLGRLRELNLKTLTNALECAAELPETASIFFNVDPTTFGPDLPNLLQRAAARGGIALNRIVLEITERCEFENPALVAPVFRELREKGVRFALDDHGSAYSHLSLFDDVRPSFIKISNTFGTKLEEDDTRRRIVTHMSSLARDFGCLTILEGIESEETASVAAGFGVELAQGYHFGRPNFASHWAQQEVCA